MRRTSAAVVFLILSPLAQAQHRHHPPPQRPGVLTPGPAPGREPDTVANTFSAKNIPYVNPPDPSREFDIYCPMTVTLPGEKKEPAPPRPLIVWVHGGGWIGGDKKDCPARALVKDGFVVASINYRLSSEAVFPAQIEDCKAAIRYLRAHAADYNIDVNRVGIWGASAGGHLAALLGTSGDVKALEGSEGNPDQSSRVQAVCDWYGPTDLLQIVKQAEEAHMPEAKNLHDSHSVLARLLGGPPATRAELARTANPITYITKDDPPFLVMHGDKDPLVPLAQSQILADALKAAGVQATFEIVKGGGHGDLNLNGFKATEEVREFFIRRLKARDASPEPPGETAPSQR